VSPSQKGILGALLGVKGTIHGQKLISIKTTKKKENMSAKSEVEIKRGF